MQQLLLETSVIIGVNLTVFLPKNLILSSVIVCNRVCESSVGTLSSEVIWAVLWSINLKRLNCSSAGTSICPDVLQEVRKIRVWQTASTGNSGNKIWLPGRTSTMFSCRCQTGWYDTLIFYLFFLLHFIQIVLFEGHFPKMSQFGVRMLFLCWGFFVII